MADQSTPPAPPPPRPPLTVYPRSPEHEAATAARARAQAKAAAEAEIAAGRRPATIRAQPAPSWRQWLADTILENTIGIPPAGEEMGPFDTLGAIAGVIPGGKVASAGLRTAKKMGEGVIDTAMTVGKGANEALAATRGGGGLAPSIIIPGRTRAGQAFNESQIAGRRLGSIADMILPPEGVIGVHRLKNEVLDRMADLTGLGAGLPRQSNWNPITGPELAAAFGGWQEAADIYTRIWAAMSPQTKVVKNTREAVAAFAEVLNNPGHQFTKENTRQILGEVIHVPGSKWQNMNIATHMQPLSGKKVNAMDRFGRGEPAVPIDTHVLHGMGAEGNALQPHLGPLAERMSKQIGRKVTNDEAYDRLEQALIHALETIEPGVPANPRFGRFWEGSRASKGEPWEGGVQDILKHVGLDAPGAMMDVDNLKRVLRSKGWTPAMVAAVMAKLGVDSQAGAPPPRPPTILGGPS